MKPNYLQRSPRAGKAGGDKADECPFCFERARDTALIPCGHVLCSTCVDASCPAKKSAHVCPVCRQKVTQTMRVFL